jgi:hypothetical protein
VSWIPLALSLKFSEQKKGGRRIWSAAPLSFAT